MVLTKDMKDFIALLEHHAVTYVIIGGFAVNYYGYVRTTQDIDILVFPSPENADKMAKVLHDFGFGNAGISKKLFEKAGTAIHLGAEPNRIDILTRVKGVTNNTIFKNARRISYGEISIKVISSQDLLACKKSSTRLKDLADADELEKIIPRKKSKSGRKR